MKILLVDNNTAHLHKLMHALEGHDVEIQKYRPGLNFHEQDKKLVILSGGGGEGLEIDDLVEKSKLWYQDEMEFIRQCTKPMIGICMGFEVMAKAYGQEVPYLGKPISENGTVITSPLGRRIFGKRRLKQQELHSWHVPAVPQGFEELARSENGVEIIYNPLRRQLATQFHPELGGTVNLQQLITCVI